MSKASALERAIRRQISSAELLPGERLPSEREMAERWGLSRSTVNQVFESLAQQGFLQRLPRQRARVLNLFRYKFDLLQPEGIHTHSDLRQVFAFRAWLEGEAAFYCAQRALPEQQLQISEEYHRLIERAEGETTLAKAKADLRFHTLIAECSHHLPVVSFSQLFYERFFNAIFTLLNETLKRRGNYPQGIRQQHTLIHQAIMKRDASKARRLASDHVLYVSHIYRELT